MLNYFVNLSSLEIDMIERLLKLARLVQKGPIQSSMRDKVLGLVFMNPSLRTLASFQTAAAQLGGSSFVISPGAGSWQLETRDGVVMDGPSQEHIREAIPVLAEYCDVMGVRCFAEGKDLGADLADSLIHKMSELCPKPFVSLESATDHPCQALADWKTLDDIGAPREGGKFVLAWGWHPRALPHAVPNAVAKMAVQRGMDLVVARPEGYDLPEATMSALRMAGTVTVTDSIEDAMEGAHAVYCKSWASVRYYGQPEAEADAKVGLRDWCAKEAWFKNAAPNARFMHCLPIRRNVEATDEMLDGPRSVVVQEAGNRLHVQKAVLMAMMEDQGA